MSIHTLQAAMVHRHGERELPLQTSIKLLEFTSSPGRRQTHSSSAIVNKTYDYHRCILAYTHVRIHLEKPLSEHACSSIMASTSMSCCLNLLAGRNPYTYVVSIVRSRFVLLKILITSSRTSSGNSTDRVTTVWFSVLPGE